MSTLATLNALECRLSSGHVLVPVDAISAIGELKVGAWLPFAQHVAFSAARWGDEAVVGIHIVRASGMHHRVSTGLLLTTPDTDIRYAIEIDAPLGIVEQISLEPAAPGGPAWLRTTTTADGRSLPVVDAQALIATLYAKGRV